MMISGLNPKQREAVEQTEGPVLILAGAGSGKTRVLTYRMAHLICDKGVAPWSIFAVTFTNKAAGEMRERIEKILGMSARDLWVSTFHSACLKILRRNASVLGYHSDFSVYNDKDQLQLITQCFEELRLNSQTINPKVVAYKINEAKHDGLVPETFAKRNTDFLGERVAQVYQLYQQKLKINQAMDFGDLILQTLVLFKTSPATLEHYQQQFRYIHVDEYQDTNKSQYQLISLLAGSHHNLCVVGDDDQSIYKFRGAEIRNILDFQNDYPEAKVIRLEQNYRSTQNILNAAGAVVKRNKGRMGKTLWTENGEGEKLFLFKGNDEQEEAQYVVNRILKEKSQWRYADMAVFYRTNAQSRPFEDELRRNRIPYIIIGGMKFYDRQEIKDMLAYLKLLVNPADAMSLKRVINVPARGIGKTTIEKLEMMASQQGLSAWALLQALPPGHDFSKGTLTKLEQFVALIKNLMDDKKTLSLTSLTEFMTHLYEKTGYWKMLQDEKTVEAEGRMENLEELVNVVEEYAKREENPTLEGFLDQASLMSDLDNMEEGADRLPLMTLHLCKGLEFPCVFMVGMEESLFPHSRSLDSEGDLEEERRLCYVGMTRAMQKLTLSFVSQRRIFGSTQYHLPSRFLEEIPEDLIEVVETKKPKTNFLWESQEPEEWVSTKSKTKSNDVRIDYSYDQSVAYSSSYRRGARVRHPQFGVGIVKACEGKAGDEKITIAFEGGQIKKILTKYANLTLLS